MRDQLLKTSIDNIHLLGFGTWQLASFSDIYEIGIKKGVDLIKEAVNQGINFFDTAPNYGLGLSETIIGEGLKGIRDRVFINTKVGHHVDDTTDFDPLKMRLSIEGSLERLQTTYLDSVILHNPPRDLLKGSLKHFQMFETLKKERKIRAYGVSIDTLEEFEIALDNPYVDVIEIMFNMMFQEPKVLFEKAQRKGILLIIKIPLDSGWLTGKYDHKAVFHDIRSRWSENDKFTRFKLVQAFKEMTSEKNMIKNALAFIKSFKEVTVIIPGIKDLKHLYSHLECIKYDLPIDEKEKIESFYEHEIRHLHLPW